MISLILYSYSYIYVILCRYDLIDLERGHGGYGGNVGDQWDVVNPDNGQLTTNACFASGWYELPITVYIHNHIMVMWYGVVYMHHACATELRLDSTV